MTSLINNPWIPWILHFMMGFTATSCVAIANYWLFHEKRGYIQDFLTLLTLFEWGGLLITGGRHRIALEIGLGVIILSSFFQTFIEKAIDKHRLTFKRQLVRALSTHLCLINVIWVIGASVVSPQTPWNQGVGAGIVAAFLLTPISISALRWILLTSKLRPGLDRLFKPDEEAK